MAENSFILEVYKYCLVGKGKDSLFILSMELRYIHFLKCQAYARKMCLFSSKMLYP